MLKKMLKDHQALFVVCLFVFFLIFLYSFAYWHSFSQKESFYEIYLEKYPQKIASEDACFTFGIKSTNQHIADPILLQVNSKYYDSVPTNISSNSEKVFEKCISNAELLLGDNIISASLGNNSIFFHVLKQNADKESSIVTLLKEISSEKEPFFSNMLIFLLFFSSFFFFIYLFSRKFGFLHGTIIPIIVFIIQSQFRVFLNYLGLPQNAFLMYFIYFASFFLAYKYLPKIIEPQKNDCLDDFDKKAFISSIILIVFLIFLHLFSTSHFSEWNVYYERQTSLFLDDTIPTVDPLSYLGRPITFDPGYFLIESAMGKLSSITQEHLFILMLFFAALLLLFSSLYLAKSLRFSFSQALFLFILLITLNFNFTNFLLSPRHIIAFSLILYSAAFFINNKKDWVWLGLILGSLIAIQMPAAIFSALFLLALSINSKKDLLSIRNILAALLALALFLFVFAPVLFNYGLPYTEKMNEWGYLLNLDNSWLMFDMGVIYYLLLASILLGLFLFKSMSWLDRKIYLAMVISLIIEFTLTFRFNIITQALFAIFLIKSVFYILPKQNPKVFFPKLLKIIFILFLLFAAYAMLENFQKETSQLSTLQELSPMLFASKLKENSNFLVEPLYAHSLSYHGKQKVLADLYTEYADTKKLDAEYDFLVNGNKAVLTEYSIDYVLLYKAGVHTSVQPFVQFDNNFTLAYLSKIYTNGLFDLYSID